MCEELNAWNAASITKDTVAPEELTDITQIQIDSHATYTEKLHAYLRQTRHPCLFRCGKVTVALQFASQGKDISEVVASYLYEIDATIQQKENPI